LPSIWWAAVAAPQRKLFGNVSMRVLLCCVVVVRSCLWWCVVVVVLVVVVSRGGASAGCLSEIQDCALRYGLKSGLQG